MATLALFAVVLGCESSRDAVTTKNDSAPRRLEASQTAGAPHLATNQVLAIAYACASAHGVDTNRFRCRSIRFAGDDPKQRLANTWILHFAPDPMSLHEDFFVDVNDLDGKAKLVRH